jgi:16S rRNA (cytosine1402-N4)-methyltransferase
MPLALPSEDDPMDAPHRPVLLRETLQLLAPRRGAIVVDGTLGPGGHAEALLEAIGPTGRLYGIDRDAAALAFAARRLARFGAAFQPIHGTHENLLELLRARAVTAVDVALFDLGLSSPQLDDPRRGFSFRADGPLDMRMDPSRGETAAALLARAGEDELRALLRERGEERRAGSIARALVRRRSGSGPIETTRELAELVERTLGPRARALRIHPATRTFQALRIAVNREIEGLAGLVRDAVTLLRPGGRVAILSYHSLEDRAVKNALRELARRCTCPPRLPRCACGRKDLVRPLSARAVRPTPQEISANPRARSARLRAAERLQEEPR